jgi:hypothetical protein
MDHINRSRPSLYSFVAGSLAFGEPSQGDTKPDQGRATNSIPAALTPAWREIQEPLSTVRDRRRVRNPAEPG